MENNQADLGICAGVVELEYTVALGATASHKGHTGSSPVPRTPMNLAPFLPLVTLKVALCK